MEIRAASNMSTLLVGESVGAGNEDTPHRAGLDGGAWAARLLGWEGHDILPLP